MAKFGITIDTDYRRLSDRAGIMRGPARGAAHVPARRAVKGRLFLIGMAAVAVAALLAMH